MTGNPACGWTAAPGMPTSWHAAAANTWRGPCSVCGPASLLVGYFTPIRELAQAVPFGLGPWEAFWIGFYGLATYGNAGFLREKVCQHMCPYGRFQGSLMDTNTLYVAYDERRGEPRAPRPRGSDPVKRGSGACGLHPVRAGLPGRHRHPPGAAGGL
ncbi:MAG: 4Fe-4S dicluster domain-containing protein [Burkholderiaceae bacterium]